MTTIFVLFALALVIAVAASRLSIFVSGRLGLMDVPDQQRRLHPHAIARFGGPAVFVAFFAPIIILLFQAGSTNLAMELVPIEKGLIGLYAGASLALLAGLLDDRFDILARWKLVGQIATALVACSFGLVIRGVTNPLGGGVELGNLAIPITVFWFVACMNAVNLVDGIDGLAAGICLFAGLAMFFISMVTLNMLGMVLSAVLAGAILGFLVFNFPPARLFLGNSGSSLLGFLIAALSILALQKAQAALALFVPVVALGLPIADTSLAMLRRWYRKVPMSTPDREHIHHVLVRMGFSHRRAVLILYSICVVLTFAAVLLAMAKNEVVILVIVFLGVMVYVGFRMFGGISFADLLARISRENDAARQRLHLSALLSRALAQVESARDPEEAWAACMPLFEALGLMRAGLRTGDASIGSQRSLDWRNPATPQNCDRDSWSARLLLEEGTNRFGELVFEACASSGISPSTAMDTLQPLRRSMAHRLVPGQERSPGQGHT
jgi:UDP-GlcNAc:undecaprenyl-phosphate GlcNAc-1-phosphate transferase